MNIAVCQLDERVAPRFDQTDELLLAEVGPTGEIIKEKTVTTGTTGKKELCLLLKRLEIDVLICGGIKDASRDSLNSSGIRVIDNVIGGSKEAVRMYAAKRLMSGSVID
jgi:predicted Fe-Mo cluster-binding NifX family protein